MTPIWWLLGFIPALVALYLLKLKRREVVVSSTYLWRRAFEDLHANAPFSRLRRNLLFFLQLLALLALIFAAWRPRWAAVKGGGRTRILLVDVSASMKAREGEADRLARAKDRAVGLLSELERGERAALFAFSDRPRTLVAPTSDLERVRRAVASLQADDTPSDLLSALTAAAASAAKLPGAEVHVVGDGCYELPSALTEELQRVPIRLHWVAGPQPNAGIIEADLRRVFSGTRRLEVFALVKNASEAPWAGGVALRRPGEGTVALERVTIDPGGARAVTFDGSRLPAGPVEIAIEPGGALAADDRAFLLVPEARGMHVVLAGGRNPYVETAFRSIPGVTVERTAIAAFEAAAGENAPASDAPVLYVFDRAAPRGLPPRRALYIGCAPPLPPGEPPPRRVQNPVIIDWDRNHPLNRFVSYRGIGIAEAEVFQPSPRYTPLVETEEGGIIGLLHLRSPEGDAVEALVVGFDILKSDWPLVRMSFPFFFRNALEWFALGREGFAARYRTGEALRSHVPAAREGAVYETPSGAEVKALVEEGGYAVLPSAREVGLYSLRAGEDVLERFAVALLDRRETDLSPIPALDLGGVEIAPQAAGLEEPVELWPFLTAFALLVLLVEWRVYHRRSG